MRIEKTQMVNDISDLLNDADYVYFIKYKGLKVSTFSDFRTKLSEHEAKCHVLKNRLVKKAVELNGPEKLTEVDLKGDTALITGHGDPGIIAKVIDDFAKSNKELGAKGGFIDNAILTEGDVKCIAALPPKEVLQAQLLGVLQAPMTNLASVLNAKVSSIVNVINAYKNKQEEQ
jgi:large subunit ribosomal protein L10